MGRHTWVLTTTSLSILLALVLLDGCAKHGPGAVNAPPETGLTFAPEPGDTTALRVGFSWFGTDPDGEVVRYWTRADSGAWRGTTATETLLVLSDAGDRTCAATRHVFEVRAEDDAGELDPTSASVTFVARNSLPETEIIAGPSGLTAQYAFFEWRGWDYDGIVASYAWELLWRESASGEWIVVVERDSIPPDEVSTFFGPLSGQHRFDVWSIDDEGAADPTPASRSFVAAYYVDGPELLVRTNVLGDHEFMGPSWASKYDTPTDVFEGDVLVFDWSATVLAGTELIGYSYAFDDTTDWGSSYSLNDVHLEVVPATGQHSLYLKVLDSLGMETRARLCVNVAPTGRDHVLLVDDYDYREELPPGAGWGTDAMRDAFYDTLTMACQRPVVEWSVEEHLGEPPGVEAMRNASSMIWYYDQDDASLGRAFDAPGALDYVPLAGYLRVGGNVVLAGHKGLAHITGETQYPMTFSASDTAPRKVFVRDRLGIGSAENSGGNANKQSPWTYGYCFYGAVPGETSVPEGTRAGFVPVYIDSVGPGGYPEPGKWFLYTSSMDDYSRAGLPYLEALQPYDGSTIEAAVTDAFLNMNFQGETSVVLRYTGTDRGNACYFGFPLYYMQTDQMVALFDELYSLIGE